MADCNHKCCSEFLVVSASFKREMQAAMFCRPATAVRRHNGRCTRRVVAELRLCSGCRIEELTALTLLLDDDDAPT